MTTFIFPALTPLSWYSAIGAGFDALMQPLYTGVSAVLAACHWVASLIMPANSGWTWVLAITMLTLIVRFAVLPLSLKALHSGRAMSQIQPKVQELQAKYGSDRERLGQETMRLYKEEGVNPMASCFPMLLQMPIFWALFQVLGSAARGKTQGWYMTQALADSMRDATLFDAHLSGRFMPMSSFGPTQILALILILLMSGLMFLQQRIMMNKNMPPTSLEGPFAQQQKMMLYLFPIMFAIGGISIPLGVLIYWCMTNLFSFFQQEFFIRNYPTLNTPAYVDWQERMRAHGKDPDEIERLRMEKRSRKQIVHAPAQNSDGTAKVMRQSLNDKRKNSAPGAASSSGRSVNRQTSANVAPSSTEQTGSQRQSGRAQPRKQSRAVRRKPQATTSDTTSAE